MGFIGVQPASAPLTASDITDGVVSTAKLGDDAVSLAKMASGTDGQVITYDASGNPSAVGPGTDGQVLTSTGAGSPPAFEDAGGSLYTKVSSVTLSGTAVANSSVFSSTYKHYFVTFDNCGTGTSGSYFRFKLYKSDGTTADNVSGGSLFGYQGASSGTAYARHWVNANASIAEGLNTAVTGASGYMYVFNARSTSYKPSFMGQVSYRYENTYGATAHIGGWMNSANLHTGFYWYSQNAFGGSAVVTTYGITNP